MQGWVWLPRPIGWRHKRRHDRNKMQLPNLISDWVFSTGLLSLSTLLTALLFRTRTAESFLALPPSLIVRGGLCCGIPFVCRLALSTHFKTSRHAATTPKG